MIFFHKGDGSDKDGDSSGGRSPRLKLTSWGATDVGKQRDHNEDSFLVDDGLGLYVVADGMGGHAAGEQASSLAVEVIRKEVEQRLEDLGTPGSQRKKMSTGTVVMKMSDLDDDPPPNELPSGEKLPDAMQSTPIDGLLNDETTSEAEGILVHAVQAASRAILEKVEEVPEFSGMGTTVSALLLRDNQLVFAHVGDSRIYQIHDGEIQQITDDHTFVNEQLKAGFITEDEAFHSRFKNIITRSVGFEKFVEVDTRILDVEPGDLFVMCSDGLSGLVKDEEIREIIKDRTPKTALQFYINLANSRGGDDNITVIILKAVEDDDEEIEVI